MFSIIKTELLITDPLLYDGFGRYKEKKKENEDGNSR